MQCNIDKKGRIARAISGVLCIILGVVVAVLCYLGKISTSYYWLAGPLIPAGAFSIYEARKSWCVMRAMGFKTPM